MIYLFSEDEHNEIKHLDTINVINNAVQGFKYQRDVVEEFNNSISSKRREAVSYPTKVRGFDKDKLLADMKVRPSVIRVVAK